MAHVDLLRCWEPPLLLSRVEPEQVQDQSHTDTFVETSQHQQPGCVRPVQLARIETWVRTLAGAARSGSRPAGLPSWRRVGAAVRVGDANVETSKGRLNVRRHGGERNEVQIHVAREVTSTRVTIDRPGNEKGMHIICICNIHSLRYNETATRCHDVGMWT